MMLGLPFSFYYQSDDVFAIIISSVLTSSIGLLTWFFTKNSERKDVGKREGYLIVTFGWILMSTFGAIPFVVHGSIPSKGKIAIDKTIIPIPPIQCVILRQNIKP